MNYERKPEKGWPVFCLLEFNPETREVKLRSVTIYEEFVSEWEDMMRYVEDCEDVSELSAFERNWLNCRVVAFTPERQDT